MILSDKKSLYEIYYRKKKNGKKRIIHAPCEELKLEQRRIKNRLEEDEWISSFCHGFRKGSSASNAAVMHTQKDWILNIDIADFFPSIRKSDLYFLDEYESEVSTYENKLVQGSPCSPIISNIILREFDEDLNQSLDTGNLDYSRYADDITISGYDKPDIKALIDTVRSRLRYSGFRVRNDKIQYSYKNSSQKVLGMTVNEKVSMNRETRKKLRAAIYSGNVSSEEMGYLAYLNSVNPEQYLKLMRYKKTCDAKRLLNR